MVKLKPYLDEGLSQAETSRRLDRHRLTISREIRRNGEERKANSLAALRYQASSAVNLARMRKRNCGTTTLDLFRFVQVSNKEAITEICRYKNAQ